MRYFAILMFLYIFYFFANFTYAQEYTEYEVKSSYIYNIVQFIEWPENWVQENTINVCIYGNNPFGDIIYTINNKISSGKKINVIHVKSLLKFKSCQILFISSSERNNLSQILEALNGMPVLTIGDTEGFDQQGIMINFFLKEKKVRFNINLASVKAARIKISSKLLRLAERIYEQ
jgi:hypothetical protein